MTELKHDINSYMYAGCRCETCRAANAQRVLRGRDRRAAETSFEDIPHGFGGYNNYKCRCPICRQARNEYDKNREDDRTKKANVSQKVRVITVCDMCDMDEEGAQPVSYSLDGGHYEMDLCAQHEAVFRNRISQYVIAARKMSA